MSLTASQSSLPAPDGEPYRILLIDPDLVVCNLLHGNLEPTYKLDIAASAEEALEGTSLFYGAYVKKEWRKC